jgi:hypothetical protein
MKYFLTTLLALAAAFISLKAYADPNLYQCQVVSDAYIRDGGALDILRDGPRMGQKFTVIKNTGELLGDVMDVLKNPRVVSSGGGKNAYKVIWEQESADKKGVFVDYLSIDASAKGKKKPFGFFSGSLLMTGFCE